MADPSLMTARLSAAGGYVAKYDVCLTHLSVFLAIPYQFESCIVHVMFALFI